MKIFLKTKVGYLKRKKKSRIKAEVFELNNDVKIIQKFNQKLIFRKVKSITAMIYYNFNS